MKERKRSQGEYYIALYAEAAGRIEGEEQSRMVRKG